MKKSATNVVREYIKARHAEFDKLDLSEKAIEVPIGDGVSVSGRIDLVRRRDTNEIAIVDLKSNKDAQAPELTDSQLNIYALGYRELTGRDADFVETYQLDAQKRIARSVHEEDIEHVKAQIKETAGALRNKEFLPKPSAKACGRCDFCRMCSSGSSFLSNGAS
jgi:DNA helicase-2/ATP-dependent DNA helicase PcrA